MGEAFKSYFKFRKKFNEYKIITLKKIAIGDIHKMINTSKLHNNKNMGTEFIM